jgi:hypothetical protein
MKPKPNPEKIELELTSDILNSFFPEKYVFALPIPKVPNIIISCGIRLINTYIPLLVGPKILAIIMDGISPNIKIAILLTNVIKLALERLKFELILFILMIYSG